MSTAFHIRPIRPEDFAAWLPLWNGYNAFYGRSGETALPLQIAETTWSRFFDTHEPVHAKLAQAADGSIIGLVHYLFHRSTTRLHDVCYLQDLFTAPTSRGRGVARQLIHSVCDAAREAGSSRVYWGTHSTNATARTLYDKVGQNQGFILYSHEIP